MAVIVYGQTVIPGYNLNHDSEPKPVTMYTIVGRLGEGRFSRVFLAVSKKGTPVALKEDMLETTTWSTLAHEATILYHLNRMGCGPTLHWFEGGPQPHLVMSLLQPCALSLDRWKHMVQAVERIHACGILHRDIKPEHFMLDPRSDTLVLTDFGFAKEEEVNYGDTRKDKVEEEVEEEKHIVGSPRYCSYHVHLGMTYGRRDDLLSTLYCLVEMVPYRGDESTSSRCAHPRNQWYRAQKAPEHMATLVPRSFLPVVHALYALPSYAAPQYAGLMAN